MEPEQVAEERVEALAVADVFDVVELGEPFDHAGQQQRGEFRSPEDDFGHGLSAGDQPARCAEAGGELVACPAHELLVFDLLFGEADE